MNRISELRNKKSLSQAQLGKLVGAAQNTVSNWENGNRIPDYEMLQMLSNIFDCSVEYIMGKENEEQKIKNIYTIKKKKIPLLGEIACGQPIFASEDRESYVMAGTDINADFCLIAKGDSMIGARIMDGDIVFIKESPIVNNGEIAAVIIGDEATLKRVYYYPEKAKLILQAENPKYEPLVYIGEELNEIRILGKAVAFQSDII
jgi:repressor LexA